MLLPRAPYSYRDDPAVPALDHDGPVAVMDAQCGLCAKGARWIARNDRAGAFKIIPIQSELGRGLAQHYGVDPDDPDTWLVIDQGQAFEGLEAVMRAGRRLGGLWRGLAWLRLIPRSVRRGLYHLVARNRYRVFGRADLCAMPDPAVQARLLVTPLAAAGPSTGSTARPSSN